MMVLDLEELSKQVEFYKKMDQLDRKRTKLTLDPTS